MKAYKVLKRVNGTLLSPIQEPPKEYIPGTVYTCDDFDPDVQVDCSRGYYATDIEGLIYAYRNLPGYEVWEVEVGGQSVEIDQFKRRYETIKLIRHVPEDEVQRMALAIEPEVGYRLCEALYPVNPLLVERTGSVTEHEMGLLCRWASVRVSVWVSVQASVGASVWDSVWKSVWKSVGASVQASVGASVWDNVRAYCSSLFPGIKQWRYIDHETNVNPFQAGIDLWRAGLVPSFDGNVWRLHAGPKATIVWQGSLEKLEKEAPSNG